MTSKGHFLFVLCVVLEKGVSFSLVILLLCLRERLDLDRIN